MNRYYTIKSVSEEGTYYLVNGWNKHKRFWVRENESWRMSWCCFKTPSQARASLTKLLKIMEDYRNEQFEVVAFSL